MRPTPLRACDAWWFFTPTAVNAIPTTITLMQPRTKSTWITVGVIIRLNDQKSDIRVPDR